MQCWFWGRTSTPRLRLCVLAFLLINIELKLHSEESKYTSASPRSTCFPPLATSAQVHRGQIQVQLGFASLYLNLALVDLSGVYDDHLVQLQLKSTAAKSRYNSASPRCTWTWPWWTWAESVVDYLVQLQLKSSRSSWSPTRLRLVGLQLDLDDFSQSRWSTPPLLCDFRLVHWRTSSLYLTGLYLSLLIVTPSCIWPRQDKPYSKYRKKISTEKD